VIVFLFERSVQVQKKFKLFGILDSFSTDQSVEIFITHADGFDVIDVFFSRPFACHGMKISLNPLTAGVFSNRVYLFARCLK